jgi:hypothetical protein
MYITRNSVIYSGCLYYCYATLISIMEQTGNAYLVLGGEVLWKLAVVEVGDEGQY